MFTKKIIPLFAIAIAVVLAVATSGFKGQSDEHLYTFEYMAPGGSYDQSDVQNIANWEYTTNNSRCSDNNVRACKIFVQENLVDNPDKNPSLPFAFTISVSPSSTGVYYVTSTDAGSIAEGKVSNKLQ